MILAAFGAVLIYAALSLPGYGSLDAPLHRERSAAGTPVAGEHYIRNAYPDAATPNMVTVALADYRSFDTLGETIVVFTAGVACWLVLGVRKTARK
jgi:multicomponent Na+:H+ antiporter subunit B